MDVAEFEELKRLPFIIDQLEAIQELHEKGSHLGPRRQCCECFHIWPCATRRLADDALGGDNNG